MSYCGMSYKRFLKEDKWRRSLRIMMRFVIKHERFVMNTMICLLIGACCLGSCSYVNEKFGLRDDNPLEEMLEKSIEHKMGIDVDLTPETSEKCN